MKYSVFTVIMKEYNLQEVVKELSNIGYDGVEWRVHEECHIKPEEVYSKADYIKKLCSDCELEIVCLSTYLPLSDYKLLKNIFHGASRMNACYVRLGIVKGLLYEKDTGYFSLFETAKKHLNKIQVIAQESGVKALLEIHPASIMPSPSLAARLVEGFNPEHIGLIFDAGNMICEGMEQWGMGLELIRNYLSLVHVKNVGWFQDENKNWHTHSTPLDKGIVDWIEVINELNTIGYNNFLSLEDFSKGNTKEKLVKDIKFLKNIAENKERKL